MATLQLQVLSASPSTSKDEITKISDLPSYNPIRVGSNQYLPMDVETWVAMKPIPINRNSHNRVSKMKKIFDEATVQDTQPLTAVVMGVVTQDFSDTVDLGDGKLIQVKYTKGDIFRLDGNTRAYYWKKYPEQSPELLTVHVFNLASPADVLVYFSFDSQEATEKANEKIQGLKNKFQWYPVQTMFNNGQFKTALDWAYPDTDAQKIETTFTYFFEQLKTLDKIGSPDGPWISKPASKGVKSQAIMAAFLIALKERGNDARVLDLIGKVINTTVDDLVAADVDEKSTFTIPQVIVAEYGKYTYWSYKRNGSRDEQVDFEHILNRDRQSAVGSTKRMDKEPQLDFLLYMIEEYVKNPKKTYAIRGGLKSVWQGKYDEYLESHAD